MEILELALLTPTYRIIFAIQPQYLGHAPESDRAHVAYYF